MSPRRDIRLTSEEQDAMTSYAKAQTVLNVRRNPRVAMMVEVGDRYSEFRGLMIRGRCDVIEDPARVEEVIAQADRVRRGCRASAEKRVGSAAAAEPGALVSAQARGPQDHAGDDRELGSPEARRALLTPTS